MNAPFGIICGVVHLRFIVEINLAEETRELRGAVQRAVHRRQRVRRGEHVGVRLPGRTVRRFEVRAEGGNIEGTDRLIPIRLRFDEKDVEGLGADLVRKVVPRVRDGDQRRRDAHGHVARAPTRREHRGIEVNICRDVPVAILDDARVEDGEGNAWSG